MQGNALYEPRNTSTILKISSYSAEKEKLNFWLLKKDMHPINAQFITILMISYLNVIQLPLYTALWNINMTASCTETLEA